MLLKPRPLDIIFRASSKAATRRRRPAASLTPRRRAFRHALGRVRSSARDPIFSVRHDLLSATREERGSRFVDLQTGRSALSVVLGNTGGGAAMTLIDEVRSFNRFYTREIGLLNRNLPATDLSLPEARVLYELAQAPEGGLTAAEIGRTLRMDKAHLSRIVARFVTGGLAVSRVSPDHRKHRLLTLTDAG